MGRDAARAGAEARRAAERAGVEARTIEDPLAVRAVAALFDELWGVSGGELFDHLLMALGLAGNYVAGAFAGGGVLVGASVGFAAVGERKELHSHITGVLPSWQGSGIGTALKLHQRAWALARGIDVISWTFDPLVRRNAVFNLRRLGAVVERYLVDAYGPMKDAVNADQGSDRLLVAWWLAGDDAPAPAEHAPAPADGAGARRASVATPADVEALRRDDPEAARRWRLQVRSQLRPALDAGWRVIGLDEDYAYVLEEPASAP